MLTTFTRRGACNSEYGDYEGFKSPSESRSCVTPERTLFGGVHNWLIACFGLDMLILFPASQGVESSLIDCGTATSECGYRARLRGVFTMRRAPGQPIVLRA